jgi:hypothetical protein
LNFDLRIGLSGVFGKRRRRRKIGFVLTGAVIKLFLIGTGVWLLC